MYVSDASSTVDSLKGVFAGEDGESVVKDLFQWYEACEPVMLRVQVLQTLLSPVESAPPSLHPSTPTTDIAPVITYPSQTTPSTVTATSKVDPSGVNSVLALLPGDQSADSAREFLRSFDALSATGTD